MSDHATAPITPEQERMWRACRLQSDAAYTIASGVRIHGAINLAAAMQALEHVMRRHITLRSYFIEEQARPIVRVTPTASFPLVVADLRRLDEATRERCRRRLRQQHAARVLPWDRPPLLGGLFLASGPRDGYFSCVLHHLIADSWSMIRFFGEFMQGYACCARGRPVSLPQLAVDYVEYARARARWLASAACARQRRFWDESLSRRSFRPIWDTGLSPMTGVRGSGGMLEITLPAEVRSGLRRLERQWRATLFMVLQAALQLAIQKWTGERASRIAVVDATRSRPEWEPLIGPFANLVLLEAQHQRGDSIAAFVQRSRDDAARALANRDYPFGQVIELLDASGAAPVDTLFQAAFVLQGLPLPQHRSSTLSIEVEDTHNGASKFPLTLYARDHGGRLRLTAEYATTRFDELTIAAFLAQYAWIVRQMIERPSTSVDDLVSLSSAARHGVLHELNDTQHGRAAAATPALHARVQAVAREAPDCVAVQSRRACLTFGALARLTTAVAGELTRTTAPGGGPEVIGVFFDRSPQLVVAILGVVAAGCTFLPLNPEHPDAATVRRLERSGATRVLCGPDDAARVRGLGSDIVPIVLDDACAVVQPVAGASPARVPAAVSPDALYVMFTSGSTGEPKGAVLPHDGVDNRIAWMQAYLDVGAADRVLLKTPITFDVSMWELFLPLTSGCTLALADPADHRDAARLAAAMVDLQVTIAHFVPSMAMVFCDEPLARRCRSLRHLVLSGEALPASLVARLRETCVARVHNLYGPTEASIDVTAWTAGGAQERGQGRPPIGRPIWNTTAWVLDEQLVPLAIGVEGELYLGGVGLARGYVNAPALTAAAFLPDPFSSTPGARLYRTGDRARLRPDGQIDFLGRRDGQVKVNGIRIELGEIEDALRRHPAVADAVAIALARAGAAPRIETVILPKPDVSGDLSARLQLPDTLTRFLAGELPFGSIVSRIIAVDRLPVSPNGKTDRRALARMLETGEIETLCGEVLNRLDAMSDEEAVRLLADAIAIDSL